MNPYLIEGPAVISFSGGRTSGLMLRRVLDAGIGPDVHVIFANTGKERHETLDFVPACAERWDVDIRWVEYDEGTVREVTHGTASRDGEPFAALIGKRKYLPNPVTRFCTQELKIRPMKQYMVALGYEHWTNVVGIRADEPRRWSRIRAKDTTKERWDIALPLVDAGVTLADVEAFWSAQPFDLQLRPHEGNCDLCFLKGLGKRRQIIRDNPDLVIWWATQEARIGKTFRNDQPSYQAVADQQDLFADSVDDDLIDCSCTD